MSCFGYAVLAGWFAVSAQVTESSSADSTNSVASEHQKQEDLAWKKRLLATSENDPLHVGANIGMELVRMPGDRPYRLLKTNWKKIPASVRKQILKGFTPGMMGNQDMNDHFFDVMHLGMSDKNAGVREFAAGYLEMQGLPNYQRDLAGYKRWRAKTEKLSAKETMKLVESVPEPSMSSEALTVAGWDLWKKQRFGDAAEKFSAAVEKDDKAVNAWNGLGWAKFNSGEGSAALPAFRKAIKLQPRHPAALNGLGQVYFSQGEYKLAEKYLKKAAPRAPAAWWGLTKVYLLTGKFKAAKPWAEKVAAGSPDDPWAKRMLEDAKSGKLSDELRQVIEPVQIAAQEAETDEAVVE
ncbi:MAG: tetratricopeptide repeat protein [Planctomycetota bacterium]